MNRFQSLLGTALFLGLALSGGAAHAQSVSNTYSSTDPFGTTTTTTITGPADAVNAYVNGGIYGAYPNYNFGATYDTYAPAYNNYATNYNSYYGYGYGAQPLYPGTSYFIPGQTIPLGQSLFGYDTTPTITTLPQVVTPFPFGLGYGGYDYGAPYAPFYGGSNFGYETRPAKSNAPISNPNPRINLPSIPPPRIVAPPSPQK